MMWFWLFLAIVFFVIAYKRLDWAVMTTIALLPSYLIRFDLFGLPTTWLEIMILSCVLSWLLGHWKKLSQGVANNWHSGRIIRPYPFSLEILILLVISVMAVGVSHFSFSAIGLWRAYFLEPILFFLVVFNVIGPDKNFKKIIFPLSLSAIGVSAVAWYQQFVDMNFLNPIWSLQGRATSIFEYSNALGLYLAPIIMLMIAWVLSEERQVDSRFKTIKLGYYFLTAVVAVLAIVFARSDGALIALAVAGALFGLLANKKIAIITLSLGICLLATIYFIPKLNLYVSDQLALKNLSGEIRKQQWRETWQMLSQDNRWFWGAGLNGYQTAVLPFHQEGIFFNKDHDPDFYRHTVFNDEYRKTHWQPVEIYLYPHNIILNFWSELGLLGALLFVWLIIKYWLIGLKNWWAFSSKFSDHYVVLGLLTATTAIVVQGLVDVPYFKNDLAVMFWLLVAMMGLLNTWNKNKAS